MTTIPFVIAALLVIGLAATPGLQSAMAKSNFVICANDDISAQVINSGVVVPAGTQCAIDESTINGNISVGNGGSLSLTDSTVVGNVTLNGAAGFGLTDSTIFGNLTLNGVSSAAAGGTNTISGDTIVNGGAFAITGTLIGKLTATDALIAMVNTHVVGKFTFRTNTLASLSQVVVDGNALCKDLDPASSFIDVTYLGKVKGCPI